MFEGELTMLRKIRITSAVLCFTLITLLFLDFTGALHLWFGGLAKIQFIPAILASQALIAGTLLLLPLLFGRIYCSVLCPLGVFQDVVSRTAGKKKKNRFSYTPALTPLRYAMLAVFVLCAAGGISWLVALLEPYSAYGRMASNLLGPVYKEGNNLLAYFAERMDSYAFYEVDVWLKSAGTLAVSVLTLGILVVLAWKKGRLYCNTLCPVGTVLGILSKLSLFKPRINEGKCTHCGLCTRVCKASCIDGKSGKIDYSRCIVCFNCTENCPQGALKYSLPGQSGCPSEKGKENSEESGLSRRKFLSLSALFALLAVKKAHAKTFDGGLALLMEKKAPKRSAFLVPAGSSGIQNFKKHCTACQLCVSVCPNQILSPSGELTRLMQPEMSFERGYCRPECVKCSEVCPTQAIHSITAVEKSSIQIGHAVWIQKNCIVNSDKVSCNNCARHCPTGAILMVPQAPDKPASLAIPIIDTNLCIGCGACEHLCPARPESAIYVEGHERHQIV